jgi:hypothetical protein
MTTHISSLGASWKASIRACDIPLSLLSEKAMKVEWRNEGSNPCFINFRCGFQDTGVVEIKCVDVMVHLSKKFIASAPVHICVLEGVRGIVLVIPMKLKGTLPVVD